MSVASGSHGAASIRAALLLVLLGAPHLTRSQLTPAPVQMCHSFHCFGDKCYQEAKFSQQTADCGPGEHHCQLIQLNASYYVARCSLDCEGENETDPSACLLSPHSTPSAGPCTLQCCTGQPLCLVLKGSALGSPPLFPGQGHLTVSEDKLPPTPPLVTTTSPAPSRNEKICDTFSCLGRDCLEEQEAVAVCPEGLDFCELKWTGSGYTAGCSQACMAEMLRCRGAVAQPCHQECCRASASGSCLQLDGNPHFNQAAPGGPGSLLHWALAATTLLHLHSSLFHFLLP